MKKLPFLLLLPAIAGAAPLEMEFGHSYDHLDHNYANWQGTYLDLYKKLGERHEVYSEIRKVGRFSQKDNEGMVGYVTPVGKQDSLTLEGSFSPEHHVLPSGSELVQYSHQFQGHWIGNVGVRHSHYDPASVNREYVGLEKYFGAYRAAYTLSESQLDGGASNPSHTFALNRYFNDTDMVGAIVSFGLEAERINPEIIRIGSTHSVTVLGRKSLTRKVSATFSVGYGHQENAYDRWGASVGLRRQF